MRLTSTICALVLGSMLLAGCGSAVGLPSLKGRAMGTAQALSTVKAVAKPTLEQAFEAALSAARQQGGATQLLTAGGFGIGRDGRLLTEKELAALQVKTTPLDEGGGKWMFSFRHPQQPRSKKDGQRMIDIDVDAHGQVRVQETFMLTGIHPWSYRPADCVPLARAIQLAMADGLTGEVFSLNLAPADGQFFGAQPTAPLAPPSYLIGTDHTYSSHRLVSAHSGLLHQEPTAADLEQMRRMMVPVVNGWHASLTHGEDRPVTREDLLRAGLHPDGVDGYIAMYDLDKDRRIARTEFLTQLSTPRWLKAWREIAIKFEYYRADRDQDERLTPEEASRVAFGAMGFKGDLQLYPLPVSPTEFAQADRDGDGSLNLNEFLPLGTVKTLRLLELEPKAANSFFSIQTKPWSH